MKIIFSLLLLILSSCCPSSPEYREFYDYLYNYRTPSKSMEESDFFLVILVDARHLDYTDNRSFFRTVGKHPCDGSKNGDVGHAWIYLHGWLKGKEVNIEGGHSGERGRIQAKYFDGIMNYNDWGYANPTPEQKCHPHFEPNPVKYLWTTQEDGFFQKGAGGHWPTFAAKINLTEEQFKAIMHFIHPSYYPYHSYALTDCQCSTFVVQVAALAGLDLDANVIMPIEKKIWFGGRWVRFWEDPYYAHICFGSPDKLEESLMKAVAEERAEYALEWYNKKWRLP